MEVARRACGAVVLAGLVLALAVDVYKRQVRIRASSSGRVAAAIAAGVGKRRKSSGVTRLTRTSVHCAERIVATSSSQGERWMRAHSAAG